jgi:hypothetical protein
MAATPQFGGTNGVPEIDMGQDGSARQSAGTALFRPNVLIGADDTRVVAQHLTQQNFAFRDNLGFTGKPVVWAGLLKVNTNATLHLIMNELNRYRHGSGRSGGLFTAPSVVYLRPTRLTDFDGTLITEAAALRDFQWRGRRKHISSGGALTMAVAMNLVFEVLS